MRKGYIFRAPDRDAQRIARRELSCLVARYSVTSILLRPNPLGSAVIVSRIVQMRCYNAAFSHGVRACAAILALGVATGCIPREKPPMLAGDWDAYLTRGSTALPGFEGWRRMGFAHFAGGDSTLAGSISRRTGEAILAVTHVATRADSVVLRGAGNPINRCRLARRHDARRRQSQWTRKQLRCAQGMRCMLTLGTS
jgi:hypothetical protein